MTKAELQERINQINKEIANTRANIGRLEGHLTEAMFWLTEIMKKEDENKCTTEDPDLEITEDLSLGNI